MKLSYNFKKVVCLLPKFLLIELIINLSFSFSSLYVIKLEKNCEKVGIKR